MGWPSWNSGGGGGAAPFNIFTIGREMELMDLQIQQAKQEEAWNQMMRPYLLKSMGLIQDPATKQIRPMKEEEKLAGMTEDEKTSYETEQYLAKRQAQAAKGELETPGYIQNELDRQKTVQGNLLSQRLGAKGANVSTPGINAKADLMMNEAGVKSNYAYGQEQQGMGLLSGYNSYLGNIANQNRIVYGGFSNAGYNLIPQIQVANQPNTFGRQLAQEKNTMEDQKRTAAQTGLMGGIGGAVSTVGSIFLKKGA